MNRNSKIKDDSHIRKMLKFSKEEQTRRLNVRVESRRLDRQLKLLEKDRNQMENQIHKKKVQLNMELKERKKDIRDVNFDGRLKRSKFGGVCPPATALVNRRLSLPLKLIPVGTEYNGYEMYERIFSRHSKRSLSVDGSEHGLRPVDEMSDYSETSSEESKRINNYHMHIPEHEMTPDDVRVRFNRRFSLQYVDNGLASDEKESRMSNPDYTKAPQARSSLALKRHSLPTEVHHLAPIHWPKSQQSTRKTRDTATPIEDSRFENLMSALSEKLDSASLEHSRRVAATSRASKIKSPPKRVNRSHTTL